MIETPIWATNCQELNQRIWKENSNKKRGETPTKRNAPFRVDFDKTLIALPFLFGAGFMSGIATILWINGF